MITPTWTLADRLRKARDVLGVDQAEMAHRLGVHTRTVARYEQGVMTPKRATLLGWAVACGVDPAWLEGTSADDDGEAVTEAVTKGYMRAA